MSTYTEDKKILETLSEIINLQNQLYEDGDINKPSLLPIDKRKRLEEKRENLLREYDLL